MFLRHFGVGCSGAMLSRPNYVVDTRDVPKKEHLKHASQNANVATLFVNGVWHV